MSRMDLQKTGTEMHLLIVGRLVLKRTLVSRRRQRKVVDKGTLFATPMISQGILQGGAQTMGHCGGKDGVH